MAWTIIKAVYGYILPVVNKDEDFDIDLIELYPDLDGLKYSYQTRDKLSFQPYTSRDGYINYDGIHQFTCCSKSRDKFIIIGLIYDEIERNLFLDERFDDICQEVFNNPTEIKDISDELFQHDNSMYKELGKCVYREHVTKPTSNPTIRKTELLTVDKNKKDFIDNLAKKFERLANIKPSCYLMLDDCISCT